MDRDRRPESHVQKQVKSEGHVKKQAVVNRFKQKQSDKSKQNRRQPREVANTGTEEYMNSIPPCRGKPMSNTGYVH